MTMSVNVNENGNMLRYWWDDKPHTPCCNSPASSHTMHCETPSVQLRLLQMIVEAQGTEFQGSTALEIDS